MRDITKPTNTKNVADITLVLEGSYPYVRGGVSSWMHQIITGLPDFTFSVLFLGTSKKHYEKMQYKLPDNVVHFDAIYLSNPNAFQPSKQYHTNKKVHDALKNLFKHVKSSDGYEISYLKGLFDSNIKGDIFSTKDFYNSSEAWDLISSMYEKYSKEPSFLNYIWNIRAIYGPILEIINGVNKIARTKVIHTISTGYAGFCAGLLSEIWEVPMILTEHGIYNKERKIDIFKTQWLSDESSESLLNTVRTDGGYLKEMWIQSFTKLSKFTYDLSYPIIALYTGNQNLQIQDGADKEKTQVIPNGISPQRFSHLVDKRPAEIPKVIGLIGRVVSIKDIRTFILSILEIKNQIPDIQGWVIGPEEEEPEYVKECKTLVETLHLEDNFYFKGFQKVEDIYPQLGICALTSLSEAQPLVVLEAFAAGVPCVTTDVGCCTELIYGINDEDCQLGAAGSVVPISSPLKFAKATVELINDEDAWKKAQIAGIKRVNNYYTENMMLERYSDIYTNIMEK